MISRAERGDTIIEVVLAVTIFSMVAIGALTIMNNGVAMAQRSLEMTLVRQQIDAQAEMLRFVQARAKEDTTGTGSYAALWNGITKSTNATNLINVDTCPDSLSEGFTFTQSATGITKTASSVVAPVYARVDGSQSQGLYIQLVPVSGGHADDAYIQACWDAPGLSRPMTLGTIVRLYHG